MVVYQRETRHRSIVLILAFVSLVVVTLDTNGNGLIDSVRNATRDALAPIRNGVEDVFEPIRDAASGVTDYGSLKDENAALKRKLAVARGKLAREAAVGSKVSELERLLDLPTAEDATGIAARIVSSSGNFERTVEINKGTGDGVFVGQPVVAGDGLVGKVTRSSRTVATVTLIDSPGFGVGVRLQNTGVNGLTESHSGERNLLLKFTEVFAPTGRQLNKCPEGQSPDTCISIGELLFTEPTARGAFPPDIAVAQVARITQGRGELEPTIVLTPLVNLDDLTYVKVLRWPEPKA
jgi:rod shape-determining protein MreC